MGIWRVTKPLALIVGSINDIAPVKYLIDSFNTIGWDCFVISDKKSPLANVHKYGAVDISKIVIKNQLEPAFLLFVEGGEMGIFPTHFEKLECPSLWWGIDTHNDYEKHLRISTLFDHSLIAQKSYVQRLHQDGIHSVSWFPLASPIAQESDADREIDMSYVGSTNWDLYPQRGVLLKTVADNVPNSVIGQQSAAEMLKTYQRSRIVFNNSLKNDINMRIFEAMGAGATLFTNPITDNGMEDLFIDGEDYVSYKDATDLREKILNLLANADLLTAIARSGMKKVHQLHTYEVRAQQIVELVKNGVTKSTYSRFQESGALVSMGMLSDATKSFSYALREDAKGMRAMLAYRVLAPILMLAASAARLVEKAALTRRLFS